MVLVTVKTAKPRALSRALGETGGNLSTKVI
jgi:hypothetical protein